MHDRFRFPTFRRTLMALALVPLAVVLAACGGGEDDEFAPEVTIADGKLIGRDSPGMYSYLGIPYAAPPVAARRWQPPAAPAVWEGRKLAREFQPHCAQPRSFYGVQTASEDCLYLNVYTPKTPGPHPVMVWIHGGAFYLGQSDSYVPTPLVGQDMIVVTFNYRLGLLGFMAHPALSAQQGGQSGNYGLMDQQAALRWVQNNIEAFGGDKSNVTIFGESAGGFSVHTHLAAPASAGLFHKAMIMSGAYPIALPQPTLAEAEAANTAAMASDCPSPQTVECLREQPVGAILNAQTAAYPAGIVPPVDGLVLPTSVQAALTAGSYNQVPVMQGNTHDEWRLFVAEAELTTGTPLSAAAYRPTVEATLGGAAMADVAEAAYPVANYPSPSVALGAFGTDLVFACTGRISNRLQANAGATVYAYEFNDASAPPVLPGGDALSFPMGAAHTSELQYLFSMRPLNESQQALSDAMVGYWTRFARTGNPNETATPGAWPAFTAGNDTYLSLTPGAVAPTAGFAADHKCDTVWATLGS